MHIPGLSEHRLRKFLLISLWLRKELWQAEALKLEVFHLHPCPKKKKGGLSASWKNMDN